MKFLYWMGGITALIIGTIGILEQTNVLKNIDWTWIWSVFGIIWALLLLLHTRETLK